MDLARGMSKAKEPPGENGDEILLVVDVVQASYVGINIASKCFVPDLMGERLGLKRSSKYVVAYPRHSIGYSFERNTGYMER